MEGFKNSMIELISLGPNCHTAGVLQKLNYKKCSYPFDWMLSNLSIVTYSIQNEFIDFIDRTNYIQTVDNKITLKNTNITYLGNMFVHKNPIMNKEDFEYYLRCVSRFKNLKSTNSCKLFVYTSYNNECLNENFKNDITLLNNVLKIFTDNKFYILILNYLNVDNNEQNTYNYIITNEYIVLNINLIYDPKICQTTDKQVYSKAILHFFTKCNPIEEICDKIKNMI